MAIAFVTKTSGTVDSLDSLTFSHNHSSGNFLIVTTISSGNLATGVTYGGVAMTKIADSNVNGYGVYGNMWYLSNPSAGANDVVITVGGSVYIRGTALSYSGVDTDSPIDAFNDNGGDYGSGYSQSIETTTNTNNTMAVLYSCSSFSDITGWGLGQTQRENIGEAASGRSRGVSDEIIASAGLITQSFTAPTDNFSFNILVALKEGIAVVTSSSKKMTLLGVGK